MPLDAAAVRCAAFEINNLLGGGRIEKVYQPERDEIVLQVKARDGMHRLVISASSQNPRIYITKTVKENPKEPPMFCMLMRKHISSGKVVGIESVGCERIIDITLECRNEMGDTVLKHIMCEIMGKNSNIILVSEEGKIIDAIKHVDLTVSRVRNVFPALMYRLPPDNERKNPLECSAEDFYEILEDAPEGRGVDKVFPGALSGISPLLAREAMYRALKNATILPGEMSDEEKDKVSHVLYEIIDDIKNYRFSPIVLYKKDEEKPVDFAVYKIEQYETEYVCEEAGSVCEAMEKYYSERDALERMHSRSYALMKTVTVQLERIRKKISLLHDTLKDAENKEKHRICGDIITANLYRMKQGDKTLTAVNYYDCEQKEIVIELDEALSPSRNAQKYYKRYQKAKTAEVEAAKQIEKAMEEMEYLESVVNEIEFARTPSELEEIRMELKDAGVIKATGEKKKMKNNTRVVIDEYLFEGYTIYSGRNNVQNDHLTLKVGRANDLWLHTKNIPGSHVVIKHMGEDFPPRVIEAAAIIAAVNSKAKESVKVEVDYCPVSHVKKPSGAKAGMVIYEGYSTAVVTPDKNFVQNIKV